MDLKIRDGLNACFGILKITNESVEKIKADASKSFQELSAKGATDNSEFASRLRSLAEKVLDAYTSVSNEFERGYKDVRVKFSEAAEHLTTSGKKEEAPVSRKKAAA
ncbi:hypothetical protein A0128_04980 [Leptospira tipperaryensis]|uniref:Chemotaxis protein n=1 Tax=Leptospira tipperaryensis TaxID=2564040 RepID=A0A1D7UUL2_9LEPT|nr:hypothetical protein [Leptospira tipperaryensis]AOP33258.1 hypothetical protein A0128_04980 [Leptospira tipperaryensis]